MEALIIVIACALIGGAVGGFIGYLVLYQAWKQDNQLKDKYDES